MRIAIHLSEEEHAAREARLATAPDENTDKELGDLAELIRDLAPEDVPLEGGRPARPRGPALHPHGGSALTPAIPLDGVRKIPYGRRSAGAAAYRGR